jgi:uncharacterized protein HemX
MIRVLASSIALALGLAAPAFAQDKQADKAPSKAQQAQQQRMKTCNAQASKKELKGDKRQDFMSECLKADSGKKDKELTAQQQKMKTCNADASKKELKGDERKAFMSKCLKAKT